MFRNKNILAEIIIALSLTISGLAYATGGLECSLPQGEKLRIEEGVVCPSSTLFGIPLGRSGGCWNEVTEDTAVDGFENLCESASSQIEDLLSEGTDIQESLDQCRSDVDEITRVAYDYSSRYASKLNTLRQICRATESMDNDVVQRVRELAGCAGNISYSTVETIKDIVMRIKAKPTR